MKRAQHFCWFVFARGTQPALLVMIATFSIWAVAVVNSRLSAASPTAGQDVDLMAKWTAASVVRYQVVAEFSGEAVVLRVGGGVFGRATVTDRFEAEFDWNATEYGLVGKPVIRNFPSKVVSLPDKGCPMTLKGPFEHATVTALVNDDALRFANAVRAPVERQLPAGTFAMPSENGPCALVKEIAPETVKTQIALPAPPGMMLAMPSGSPFAHNGKAFTIKDTNTETRGWTYTITPTIVK